MKLSGLGVGASEFILIASLLLWAGNVFAQSTEKESVAVVELGGAAERSLTEGNSSFGPTVAVEVAPGFMFWPSKKHRFGWYLEPSYDYKFGPGHEHSLGVSGGLLISIP